MRLAGVLDGFRLTFKYKETDFPIAEEVCKKIISLPMHPFLSIEDQDLIINQITSYFRKEN